MRIAEFLAARLDEDEATANCALMWQRDHRHATFVAHYGHEWGAIDDYDPARALRDVDAKRQILAAHAPGYPVTFPEPSGQPTCGVCHAGGWDWDPESWPCPTVRALGAVYSDHPDFDPAWAAS